MLTLKCACPLVAVYLQIYKHEPRPLATDNKGQRGTWRELNGQSTSDQLPRRGEDLRLRPCTVIY